MIFLMALFISNYSHSADLRLFASTPSNSSTSGTKQVKFCSLDRKKGCSHENKKK